ncbi:MAG: flippase-like domain-containing protein [Prochlorococcaceae cyanobacterium]
MASPSLPRVAAASQPKTKPWLAVFDVDGTLLRGDGLLHLARRLHSPRALLRRGLALLPCLLAWTLGRRSTTALKERFLELFITSAAGLEAQLAGPWAEELLRWLKPAALARLRMHQRQGQRVVLCSASPRPLLQGLADHLGVELVATELAAADGRWQPHLSGRNCKGAEKLRRLEEHCGALEQWQLEAYGDSRGDRELLLRAERPHYRSFSSRPQPYPAFRLGPLLVLLAAALLGYGLLGFWSKGSQLLPLLERLWPTVLLGLALVLVGYGIRWLRWRLLLAAAGERPPALADARIWMGSFAFTATPGKSGEALRSLLLRQECGTPPARSLMALVTERLSDGTAVLLLLLLNLPLLIERLPAAQTAAFAPLSLAISGLVAAALALLLGRPGVRQALMQRLIDLVGDGAGTEGLRTLKRLLRPGVLLAATGIGALAWSLEGISLALLLRAIGVDASWGGCIVAHTAAGLIGALSMLPGGLGSTELGTVGLLSLQGVPLAAATPATLLIRLMTLWFATAIGLLCLLLPSPGHGSCPPTPEP